MHTVRLDAEIFEMLERLAKERGQTRSDVVRDAIAHLMEGEEISTFDRLQPFAGVADSGGRNLSHDAGRKFRGMLEAKRRASEPP